MVHCISILGSTGSIGTQTLSAAAHLGLPVAALSARERVGLLEQQARSLSPMPRLIAVYDEAAAKQK